MACDPKKIFTDLNVVGAILTYAELWVAGTKKVQATINTNTLLNIFNFEYKNINYFNVFISDAMGTLVSAEIRQGSFTVDGQDINLSPLIERIIY